MTLKLKKWMHIQVIKKIENEDSDHTRNLYHSSGMSI
jgi:hypothetical protein